MKLLLCLLSLSLLTASCTRSREIPAARTIVEVNGKTLTAKDFAGQLAEKLRPHSAISAKDQHVVASAKESIIRDFVIRVITEDWANEKGIMVKAEDLDAYINGIRASYPDDLAFQQVLAEEGLSFKDWRERISFSLLQQVVIQQIKSQAQEPAEEELLKFYNANKSEFQTPEQYKLRQIVLANETDADSVLAKLKSSGDFEALAKQYSVTPEAKNGGDLGYVERGVLDVFDQAIKIGRGRTGILKTAYGYHIIENLGRRPAQTSPFSEVKSQIRRRLLENREQAVYSKWLEERVRLAKVFRDEALLRSLKVETKGK